LLHGQGDFERAFGADIRQPEIAAMPLNDRFADGESQPETVCLRGEERIEDAFPIIRGDARTGSGGSLIANTRIIGHSALGTGDGARL